jgi:hypothetical protein
VLLEVMSALTRHSEFPLTLQFARELCLPGQLTFGLLACIEVTSGE